MMMATAIDQDIDLLGLNLVFDDPKSMPGDATMKSSKKRKTKYDKRRERGRLAKLAKLEKKQAAAAGAAEVDKKSCATKRDGDDNRHVNEEAMVTKLSFSPANITTTLNEKTLLSSSPSVSKIAQQIPAESNSVNDNNETTVKHDKNQAETCINDQFVQSTDGYNKNADGITLRKSNTKPTRKIKLNSAVTSTLSTIQNESTITAKDIAKINSSRRHREQTVLTDEQRAKYLSEFHARPRELDRNERASRVIKKSCASDHIFALHDDDDQNDEANNNSSDEVNDKVTTSENSGLRGSPTTRTTDAFSKLGLHPNLISTITSPSGHFKLSQPTIIQSRCITALLLENHKKRKSTSPSSLNLFIQSETGSGKTLAYLLPILQQLAVASGDTQSVKRINRQMGGTRCIILCPTRELATQTFTFTSHLCKSFPWIVPGCFSGGEKRKSEKARLRKGISILIGTPGRLLDHLSKTESLLMALKNKLEWLVLDESDRLLDAGLGGQVEQIVQHLRSNQPGAGSKRDGVTWRSVLVSATITSDIEGLAKTVLGGEGWLWARGHTVKGSTQKQGTMELVECDDDANAYLQTSTIVTNKEKSKFNENELDNVTPRQLTQLFVVVNAKLRLVSLIAFLSARATKGERTVVFLSTCDSVDYHHALMSSMDSILGNGKDCVNENEINTGIFGKECPIFKLHGDIPHIKRIDTINEFNSNKSSAILLATDVAARGLNFPALDWIVQYDPPCETNDYCHRAGRSARAGQAGHSLLFLLPTERQYVEVLKLRGLKDISALSLSSTLTTAVELCRCVTKELEVKTSDNKFSDDGSEAFTAALQKRLEECVIRDDLDYKASIETKFKGDPKQRRRQKKDAVGPLLEGARKAFSAFVRAYPAKEKAVRHIFNARALHLGHIARSLALKEAPKMASKGSVIQSGSGGLDKRKSRLTFGKTHVETNTNAEIGDMEQKRNSSLLNDVMNAENERFGTSEKLNRNTRHSGQDVEKRMMEAAIVMQTQEFM